MRNVSREARSAPTSLDGAEGGNMTELSTKTKIRWATRSLAFLLWAGIRRPSVLWHYIRDNLRYFLVKGGVLSSAARHVAEVRAAFEAHAAQGQFKELFFDMNDIIGVAPFRGSSVGRTLCAFLKSGRGRGVPPCFS